MSEGSDRARFQPVAYTDWRARVERDLGGPVEALERSGDSVLIRTLYSSEHLPDTVDVQRADVGFRVVAWVDPADLPLAASRAREDGATALYLTGSVDPAALAELALPTILRATDPGLLDRLDAAGAEFCFDPIGHLASAGGAAWDERELSALLEETARHGGPSAIRPIYVDATRYHDAGASAADEIAFALATGVYYLRSLDGAGLSLGELPARMRFAFSCDADVFGSVSKLRSARLAWSKVLSALGVGSRGMYVHAFQSRRALTALDPLMGVARGCAAGFAAIVGGAQDVTLAPHEPTDAGSRLAQTTQALLREEAHLAEIADPGAGSCYIEARTDALARAAWSRFQEIERSGGMLEALSTGVVQRCVEKNAASRAGRLRIGAEHLVGVTRYPSTADLHAAPEAASVVSRSPGERDCRPLTPVRDAAPYERLRRRAQALPAERRRAWVVRVGQGRSLNAQVEAARELLEMSGLNVEVVRSGEVPPPPPATVAVCSAESDASGIIRDLRSAGAQIVLLSSSGAPADGAAVDGRIVAGMDVPAEIARLLGRLEHVS